VSNVVNLHGEKRWKAVLEYRTEKGDSAVLHFLEEIADLHLIMEHGADWNSLVRCTVTLNRPDDGDDQNSDKKALVRERSI
jgi:hypothetical protein